MPKFPRAVKDIRARAWACHVRLWAVAADAGIFQALQMGTGHGDASLPKTRYDYEIATMHPRLGISLDVNATGDTHAGLFACHALRHLIEYMV
ncbi:MAG: hypothetical protein MJ056_06585 [Akkermansia sp.]|nr:hypothetical protein [Akkermansia sp.]